MGDYYAILEIPPTASVQAIKQAYRRLALRYHPDVSGERGCEEAMKRINEAYDVLSDPQRRSHYDTTPHFPAPQVEPFDVLMTILNQFMG